MRWERRKSVGYVHDYHATAVYFVIYILKIVPDRIPSMNAPRNLPHQGKCLVSERRLAGTNRQKLLSLSLFEPIDWLGRVGPRLHLGTLIRLTFPICTLLATY